MAETADVAVVGAGVIGCSVAYYLAQQGAKVIIVEREAIGSGASFHATGSLLMLGMEFSEGPPFQLGMAGYHLFPDLVRSLEEETGMDLLCQHRPALRLALDEEEEKLLKDLMVWQGKYVPVKWIDEKDVHQIEPRLTPSLRGAVYEEESIQLDSYRLTLALAQAAEQKGAQIQLRETTGLLTQDGRVTGVRTAAGEVSCGTVVLAAGAWSSRFSKELNFTVPVRPLKGERLMLRYAGDPLPVLISSPKRGHMISRMDGLLSVGSTGGRDYDQKEWFLGEEFDRVPSETAKVELLQRAIDVFPALEGAELVQQLAGSRPLSPDQLPIIGPVPGWQGVVLATGHGTKGIHLGPITGKNVAEYIQNGCTQVPEEIETFSPGRFSDTEEADFYAAGMNAEE
ncbi:MAG: FAD-dependent oxidoreductase [Dehalococcoidia bacterium]|jgi:glycine oxidase|nr:FAD-dependent oxidoreductase [Dehalococcoidia bacterium]MDP6226523.1 FAD-dependent oxidoreductase [Dehalococcoidia bacterium]MDP7084732.1 FAD-dependent oxidoreductase [Dehalococcoidia bacterium]MDP7201585.1 FAD-dependent oxidoreductase [Dehalococcoidia bacterium]MDP7510126.1 FAD-dependent oxidoreductase [Dehalococcoidia bacterium]